MGLVGVLRQQERREQHGGHHRDHQPGNLHFKLQLRQRRDNGLDRDPVDRRQRLQQHLEHLLGGQRFHLCGQHLFGHERIDLRHQHLFGDERLDLRGQHLVGDHQLDICRRGIHRDDRHGGVDHRDRKHGPGRHQRRKDVHHRPGLERREVLHHRVYGQHRELRHVRGRKRHLQRQ
jgi:hypothetical protein